MVEKGEVKVGEEVGGMVKWGNGKWMRKKEGMGRVFDVVEKEKWVMKWEYWEKEERREEIEII